MSVMLRTTQHSFRYDTIHSKYDETIEVYLCGSPSPGSVCVRNQMTNLRASSYSTSASQPSRIVTTTDVGNLLA